ncbi:hypothetical protein B9G98_01976 [Wickerhamiella sorbophila]|uniref:Glutamate carboxypeptidase 2 n=1 Tax=Wickerhamiella sorbophila TaxID=45607 RepID=A0A2T0FH98_9ASCO|nr:hypothetical protein B9G98_01976 [Wickerhamiella sorbophila]PRT54356.1 hypothetical protein B9G98_01976 [Wickerhamiella sorbophila]
MDSPPDYEAATGRLLASEEREFSPVDSEQFDIEEPEFELHSAPSGRVRGGASGAARSAVLIFKNRMVIPVRHFVVDPVYQLWIKLGAITSQLVGRFMNPLLAKRFLVLFSVVGALVFVYWKFGNNTPATSWLQPEVLQASFATYVSREYMRHTSNYLQNMTHVPGTSGSTATAEFLKATWESYGIDEVELNMNIVFLTFANQSSLELLNDKDEIVLTTVLDEDSALESPLVSQKQPKPHMGLGVSGDVKGHLVYANYGTNDDFTALESSGVSLKGAIVIFKHGKTDASTKIMVAEKLGAVGALMFSEKHPTLAAWPEGPDYSEGAVQRAGMGIAAMLPGDVLSPGWNSRIGMRVEDYHECRNLIQIPVIGLSWRQVAPYLNALVGHGSQIPEWHNNGYPRDVNEWWTGDSSSPQAHLAVDPIVLDKKQVSNVIGMMRGTEQEELSVVIGARYDDVCFGGVALSGITVLNQVAKALASMRYNTNWRPRRSIYFAAWTGTADNFIGSTEWTEAVRDQLINTNTLYIDLDPGAWGPNLDIKGHPSIDVESILKVIDDPKDGSNENLLDTWRSTHGTDNVPELPVHVGNYMALSSHAASPFISLGFRGDVYPADSCFDTHEWQNRFGDRDLRYAEALAKICGYLAIQYSDEPILPYNFERFGNAMNSYLDDVKDYAHERFGKLVDDIDWQEAHSYANSISQNGIEVNKIVSDWLSLMQHYDNNANQEPPTVAIYRHMLNNRLVKVHMQGFDRVGLPKREWFKNHMFGPQFVPPQNRALGGTFPGLRDAIASGNFESVIEQAKHVWQAIGRTAATFLE